MLDSRSRCLIWSLFGNKLQMFRCPPKSPLGLAFGSQKIRALLRDWKNVHFLFLIIAGFNALRLEVEQWFGIVWIKFDMFVGKNCLLQLLGVVMGSVEMDAM